MVELLLVIVELLVVELELVDEAQGDGLDVIANREEGRLTRSRCWKMMLMWRRRCRHRAC